MKHTPRALVLSALLAAPLLALAPRAGGAEATPVARVIVKYRADGALSRETIAAAGARAAERPQHARTLAQRTGLALRDGHVVMPRVQVLHASGLSSAELVARLQADPDVEYAEVDQRARIAAVPNDPIFTAGPPVVGLGGGPVAGQWYLRTPDATLRSAINAQAAWDISQGTGVVVAVLDTGVRLTHPDLAGKLLPGHDFVAADPDGSFGTAGDGNGRDTDPTDPGDWVSAGQCGAGQSASSSSWHGTQVSGLIAAATNNGIGIAGSGYNTRVLPVRVLGKCGGYQSDIVAGMRWAAGLAVDGAPANANPARVVNLSLGSAGTCSATYQAAVTELTNAGVAVVAAGGNEIGAPAIQPANCAGAIGVAGIRHLGTKVGFSNLGAELAIAAPGGNCVNIGVGDACLYPLATTTNAGAQAATTDTYSDSFDISVGTSFAAPLVSGTVALMVAVNPALTVAQVRAALQGTARAFPTTGADAGTPSCQAPRAGFDQDECYCTTTTCGAGMLDAAAAVSRAAAAAVPIARIADPGVSPGVGTSFTLDGATSSATPGRNITGYAWAVTAGGTLASITGAANAASVTLALAGTGAVTVQLTVTDSSGGTGSTTRSFVVAGPPAARIVASPAQPTVGVNVSLDGSTSTAEGNRSIATWQWQVAPGSAGAALVGAGSGPTASVSFASAGSFEVQLTVTDNGGGTAVTTRTVTTSAATGGGGGGALGWPWLAALALAVGALRRRR